MRLLAGTCLFAAWLFLSTAFREQDPDAYWMGVAFAGEAFGLLRRLQWARVFALLGLALAAGWLLWQGSREGATVGGTLAMGAALLAGWCLARHPDAFTRRWW